MKPVRSKKLLSEINVTPMVDVMLVLLIVFMITAPLLSVGIKVDLPESQARNFKETSEPLTVTITENGALFIQKAPVGEEQLLARLAAIAQNGYEERIFIRADEKTPYGDVARVMGIMDAAGYRSLGLVAKPAPGRGSARP